MAFPNNPGAIPGMNPNAGMSEQEQQMVKAVRRRLPSSHTLPLSLCVVCMEPSADVLRRCKQAWKAA